MKFLISLIFLSLLGTAYSSQNPNDDTKPAQSIEELRQQLEKVLEDGHIPGMSVAVVCRDGQDWVAGLGKADVASGRAATADTLFRIGSTSKAFASLAVLKLVEQGKLSLEDSVRNLAPEVWFENRWEASDPVRIVHLLEHTTGWDDMHLREYANDSPAKTLLEAFDYDHHSRISRWRPGTRHAYCNPGPAVAAYIIEKITGNHFEDYVECNLFKPIGMATATYFQPAPESITTLYHNDGKTPHAYWDIMFRPAGSINASANDMAHYLHFYLNRGHVNGTQVVSASSIDRMEVPASTWAAKEGLKVGYGLGSYWAVYDGFVYHGHDGGVPGGLTQMAYMSTEGVGYFYSINAANPEAFDKIGKIIRAYITRELQKPPLPSTAPLSANATKYTGWYESNSPRAQFAYFLERLLCLTRIHFEDSKLFITCLGLGKNALFLPVNDTQFRYVPKDKPAEPIPTVKLLTSNGKSQFIQGNYGLMTLKRIPTWLAMLEIGTTGFVLFSITSILLYAPFWAVGGLIKKRRRPAERNMRLWPLVATLSLIGVVVIFILVGEDLISLLGNLTVYSLSLFLLTILFAVASIASVRALWCAPKQGVRRIVRIYSTVVIMALVITTAYLAYWGIIGLRTWA